MKAKQAKPKILISEGTRIDTDKKDSEAEVKAKITDLISGADGLVFVEHPVRDLDRINTMYESAKANDREFVVNFKLAYLVQSLGDLCPFKLDDVKILVPKKGWGLIDKKGIDPDLLEQDYNKWERDFIDRDNSIIYSELKENPSKYVVSMNMWEINQLSDINPKNAVWIKSSCEPFDEEMKIDEKRKKNWLRHYKIKEYSAHASGHASGDKIREMIKEINPEKVIPIHTENPELY
jgi:ribonuclease J